MSPTSTQDKVLLLQSLFSHKLHPPHLLNINVPLHTPNINIPLHIPQHPSSSHQNIQHLNAFISPIPQPPFIPGNLPSHLICPFSREPPLNAYIFAIPNGNNSTSEQVFGYNDMYRFISMPGILEAARNVIHPTTRASIRRDLALGFLRPVDPVIQRQINQEH